MTGTLSIARSIYRSADWLGTRLMELANQALTTREDGKYPLAVGMCGNCMDGILIEWLRWQTNSADPQPNLGRLIGAVRETGLAPSELKERLNEAVLIRNRAAHDHPGELMRTTEDGSLQIPNILALASVWCGSSVPSSASPEGEVEIPAFPSLGSSDRLDQGQFINALRSHMRVLGVWLLGLSAAQYSADRPFDQIRDVLKQCGAVLMGLERSHAYKVFERENSELSADLAGFLVGWDERLRLSPRPA